MQSYKCTVCGYVYDPEEGDPDVGIPLGTLFEVVPDDWICPDCAVSKNAFKKVD
jgi:rubredoxin